jgi:hypothetical protein
MDHTSISQDQEDLARYRAGLAPIQRKEINLGPESLRTSKQVEKEWLELLNTNLDKRKKK